MENVTYISNMTDIEFILITLGMVIAVSGLIVLIWRLCHIDESEYQNLLYQLRSATKLPLPDGAIKTSEDAHFARRTARRYRRLLHRFESKGQQKENEQLHKIRCEVFFRFGLGATQCKHEDIRLAYNAYCATKDVSELLNDKDTPYMDNSMPTPTDNTIAQIREAVDHLAQCSFDSQIRSAANMEVGEYRRFFIFWHRYRISSSKVESKTNALNKVKKRVKDHVTNYNTLAGILNNELDHLRLVSKRNLFLGSELLRNAEMDCHGQATALAIPNKMLLPALTSANYMVNTVGYVLSRCDDYDFKEKHATIVQNINAMLSGCLCTKSEILRGAELAQAIHKTNWGFRHIYMPLHQKVYMQHQPLTAAEVEALNAAVNDISRLTLVQR